MMHEVVNHLPAPALASQLTPAGSSVAGVTAARRPGAAPSQPIQRPTRRHRNVDVGFAKLACYVVPGRLAEPFPKVDSPG